MESGSVQPFVTVIMPIRNEADFIVRSLSAVLNQDYPHTKIEVLIADGMSIDATRKIVDNIITQTTDITIRVIDNPEGIVPTGFNRALLESHGDIIVRVDGHTIIEPNYITECVAALQRTGADNVGGRMTPLSTTLFGKAVALATSTSFGVGGSRFHYSDHQEWVDTVYMGTWPKEVFSRIGMFDKEFVRNQDDEFNYRLRSYGGKILLSPLIKSTYYNRSTPKSLWRQYYQYGFYKVRVLQKHPLQMRPRQFVPVVLVLGLIIIGTLALFVSYARLLFLAFVVFYIGANLIATFITSLRSKLVYVAVLPLVFAILHFSYGMGFAVGLVYFSDRWLIKDLRG